MTHDLHDTIVALSSAPGPSARAIVRLSGPQAVALVARLQHLEPEHSQRHCHSAELHLPELHSPLPADIYIWPAPRTYTGQLLVEIHTLGSPPLVELLIGNLLSLLERGRLGLASLRCEHSSRASST